MDRQDVGIDFHRRRSVILRMSAAGEKLAATRVANDPLAITEAVAEAGPERGCPISCVSGSGGGWFSDGR